MQFWAMIVDSFRESRDSKIFWLMLAISVIVAGSMACVSFDGGKVDILFGMWEPDASGLSDGDGLRTDLIATIVVEVIMDLVLGWIGVTLAVIATAGLFPALMQRGAIDVVLSKPMRRWKVFLGRYLGSLTFILFHATVFVVLTFLVVGLRWHIWLPGYLLRIPLIVLLFSYLYCVSAYVAVVHRSTVAAALLTLGAWVAFFGIQTADDWFTMYPKWQQNREVYRIVRATRWVVPKTQDITLLAKKWSGAASSTELMPEPDEQDREMVDRAGEVENARMEISPVATIGSSLLFEAVIVLLAMWRFTREDF